MTCNLVQLIAYDKSVVMSCLGAINRQSGTFEAFVKIKINVFSQPLVTTKEIGISELRSLLVNHISCHVL